MATAPRVSGGRLFSVVTVLLACIGTYLWFWVQQVEARRWAELQERTEELLKKSAERPMRRPVLRDEPLPGNAWYDYQRAQEATVTSPPPGDIYLFLDDSPAAVDVVRAFVSRHQSSIRDFRRGTRRSLADPPKLWMDPRSENYSENSISDIAAVKTRFLREEGRVGEAADLALDIAQYGRDVASDRDSHSAMIGLSIMWRGLDELRRIAEAGSLSPREAEGAAAQLRILDSSFPSHARSVLNDAAAWGSQFTRNDLSYFELICEWNSQTLPSLRSWRYGFSRKLVMVDLVDTWEYWSREMASAGSWKAERAVAEEMVRHLEDSPNPLLELSGAGGVTTHYHRERRAQLRLLQAALHHHGTGEVPDLEDPFGEHLRFRSDQEGHRFWSVGSDGKDNDGFGSWRGESGQDLVLAVPRFSD